MASNKLSPLPVLLLAATLALGHGIDWPAKRHAAPTPTLGKRQNPYPSGPEYDIPTPIAQITALPTDYSSYTLSINTVYASGVAASLSNAPVLPERMFLVQIPMDQC